MAKVGALMLVKPLAQVVAFLVGVAAVAYVALSAATYYRHRDELPALQAAAKHVDTVEITRWDTVQVKAKERKAAQVVSDSLDKAVTLRDDSTVIIRDTVRIAPPELIADNKALRVTNAALLAENFALYQHDTTRQWQLSTHDKMYQAALSQANAPRWGVGVTIGYGCGAHGCGPQLTAGVTYQAKLPSLTAIVRRAVK